MDPATAMLIGQGLFALIELWKIHANKPKDWTPTKEDFEELLQFRTPEQIKQEAKDKLGL